MIKKLCLFMTFFVMTTSAFISAQRLNEDELKEVQDIFEILAEEDEEIANNDTYFEKLIDLYDDKINVNKASFGDLQLLVEASLLSEKELSSLMDYKDNVGKIINKYELQAIPGWDLSTVKKVLPFLDVKGEITDFNVTTGQLLFGGKHEMFIRYSRVLEEQAGYIKKDTLEDGSVKSNYLGDQNKLYARYRHKYGRKISYGITAEKDAGEELFKGSQKQGFDFYSAHIFLRDVGPFKSIALGDYRIKMGQGLAVWTDVANGKSPYIESAKRQSDILEAYTSVNEYLFFRGAAASVNLGKKMEATGFVSLKQIDNSIDRDTIQELNLEIIRVGSIQEGGLHRTESEYENKRSNSQFNTGGEIKIENQNYKLSFAGIYTKFSNDIGLNNLRFYEPYNLYRFAGDELLNLSLSYKFSKGNINFFGETALSNDLTGNTGLATLNGAIISMHPKVDFSILHRFFQGQYQSLFGDPFMESSTPTNEHGLYMGLQIKPYKKWTIQAYSDFYTHPWIRYRVDAPTNGHEQLIQVIFKPSRTFIMYGRFDTKTEGKNIGSVVEEEEDLDNKVDLVYNQRRNRWRLDVRFTLDKTLTFKSRIQTSTFESGLAPKERGYMLYQEVSYSPLSFPLSFDARYALFDVDGSDARIYTYEKDVLYFFSIPSFNNRGRRFYLNLRYNLTKNITLWGRWARTTYDNINEISTGNEKIIGRKRTEVKGQIRFRF